jgi:hypothetical protein
MAQYINGALHALKAVKLYMEGSELSMGTLMSPNDLPCVPNDFRDILPKLNDMRTSGPNPMLNFRVISKKDPKHSWFPIEFDGEYRLWGYVSNPVSSGLRCFYIQELPLDIMVDTQYTPKTYMEIVT